MKCTQVRPQLKYPQTLPSYIEDARHRHLGTGSVRSSRFALALYVAFLVSGCRHQAPTRLTVYMCGCDQCAEFSKSFSPRLLAQATIIFHGGPGDAAEFSRLHCSKNAAVADIDGKLALSVGVDACPAVRLEEPSGKSVVLGNGKILGRDLAEETERALGAAH